jgi:DNA sulfur modification protein DndD
LIIERLEMENFGPFYGSQILELGVDEQPLVVIHGRNMSGKTTVLNAVRWALYGVARDRAGDSIPTRDLINYDAFDEGQRRVSVNLTLRASEGGERVTYVLRRQRRAKEGGSQAEDEKDFDEFVSIERDGDVLKPAAYQELVDSLLPEGISRFFLFDGELLNEYEDLVRQGGEAEAQAVKQAIEMILGLPAARKGREDVQALREEASRRLQREARKHKQAKEASEELDRLSARKEQLESDQEALSKQHREVQAKLRGLDEGLKRYEESREDAGRLEAYTLELSGLHDRRKELMDERKVLVKDLWRDVLHPKLRQETERLDEERLRRDQAVHQVLTLRKQINDLSESLKDGNCSRCGQDLPEEMRARTRSQVTELNERVSELEPWADTDRLQELAGVLRQLRSVAPAGKAAAVGVVEKELDATHLRHYRVKQDLERVKERLLAIDTEEILDWDRQKKQYEGLRSELASKLKEAERELGEVRSEVDRQQRIILQSESPAFQRLEKELSLLRALEDVFGATVDELTDELRREVEKHASEIFMLLTTDKSYGGLRINENYGLIIERPDGEPVSQRSAGAEQVVALSLLAALNRLATRRGPVIMDTPFGRLDRGHRANILRFVPSMADQVVLLVHDGEVDRTRDLSEIQDRISAEYRIDHPGSTRSELIPERALARA